MPLFYTCVPKIMIIWCMLAEIWSATDMVPEILGATVFLSFRAIFCLLTLLTTQKIKILKKKPADIIILHLCQMNDNQIIYVSWDIKLNRIFSHFGPFFCPFTPHPPPKFWKMKKKTWRYHHFTQVHQRWQLYNVWFPRYFCPFTPLTTQKIKILKKY